MGTEVYDGSERRYTDLPITDLLHMMGKVRPCNNNSNNNNNSSSRSGSVGVFTVLCYEPKREYLLRLLREPLPVESHLDGFLHDHLCAEVSE